MKTITAFIAFLLLMPHSYGGIRLTPEAYAIASTGGGNYVFTMVPGSKGNEYKEGYGICYKVMSDGSMKEYWRTKGWYSRFIELHYNGQVLARIGGWASGDQDGVKDPKDSLALALYTKGSLTREYMVKDLVKDESKLRRTTAGLRWLEYNEHSSPVFLWEKKVIQLITVDQIRYHFDEASGKIKLSEQVAASDR